MDDDSFSDDFSGAELLVENDDPFEMMAVRRNKAGKNSAESNFSNRAQPAARNYDKRNLVEVTLESHSTVSISVPVGAISKDLCSLLKAKV